MRLTESDASFIYMESASGPMHISSVYVLDGEVLFTDVFKKFEAILPLVPLYRRKLAQVPFGLGHPTWVDDLDLRGRRYHFVIADDTARDDRRRIRN
ncbi:MAG: wax ester/triacylglycerol synthase domain-containing protein [Pseudomonadales bacterium]|jgi:hypothetical protein